MKRKASRRQRARDIRAGFVRGFVATGLLAVIEERVAGRPPTARRLLRRALQGGSAMAAGTAAADALADGRPAFALGAVASGAAALWGIERLLNRTNDLEKSDGQEETGKEAEEKRLDAGDAGGLRRLGQRARRG